MKLKENTLMFALIISILIVLVSILVSEAFFGHSDPYHDYNKTEEELNNWTNKLWFPTSTSKGNIP